VRYVLQRGLSLPLAEYDVPDRGGEKEQIRPWVDALRRAPINHKARVLFFDESQVLTPKAIVSLLKDVEEPEPACGRISGKRLRLRCPTRTSQRIKK
jgi:hypothetical protein